MPSTILSSRTFSTALAFTYTRSGGPMDTGTRDATLTAYTNLLNTRSQGEIPKDSLFHSDLEITTANCHAGAPYCRFRIVSCQGSGPGRPLRSM